MIAQRSSMATKQSSSDEERLDCFVAGRTTLASPVAPRNDEVFQTILNTASASTACATKPTVKASVRNTGTPIV